MQRHKQWEENRQYQHHLSSLMKIRQKNSIRNCMNNFNKTLRIKNVQSANPIKRINIRDIRKHSKDLNQDQNLANLHQKQPQYKTVEHGSCISPQSSSLKKQQQQQQALTLKQKQILINNFLLGKRIIQTPSVINLKKHAQNYQKHKRMLNNRYQRIKQYSRNAIFRESKLREYSAKNYQINNYMKFAASKKYQKYKYVISIKINKIKDVKNFKHSEYYIPFNDFRVKIRYSKEKKGQQQSQIVNSAVLQQQYWFYFGFNSKLFSNNNPPISTTLNCYTSKNKQNQNILQTEAKFRTTELSPSYTRNVSNNNTNKSLDFDIIEVKGIDSILFGTFAVNIPHLDLSELKQNQIQQQFIQLLYKNGKKVCQVYGIIRVDRRKNILCENSAKY